MYQEISINLLNLLLSLSDALDLASPYLALHQMRTALTAWEIAKVMKVPTEDMNDLFIASLLHDVGALSLEEKVSIHQFEEIDTEPHCIWGEAFLEKVPLFVHASKFVRYHHTSQTRMNFTTSDPVFYCSQILQLADYVERLIDRSKYILHQDKQITNSIISLDQRIYSDAIEAFRYIAVREDFWLDLTSPRLYSILLHSGPVKGIEIDLAQLISISELFKYLIDFRSKFTSVHSTGVATAATNIARKFGLTDTEIELMKVAGNLHDLGKLVIPNSILEKPGKLTEDEFALMKQHTYFTYSVLTSIGGIQDIAEWAAFHHEHLDGSGYPFHLRAPKLSTGARIMAVADIFTALSEDRPYRKGMVGKEIQTIIVDSGEKGYLDQNIIEVLMDNFDEIISGNKEKQSEAYSIYLEEFNHTKEKPASE